MQIEKVDLSKGEYTDEELEAMGKILLKAEEIKANKALFDSVEEYMQTEAKKVKSLKDLRRRASELAITEKIKG